MIIKGEYIYGTLKECVDELWKRIDWKNRKFPDFDYAAIVDDSYLGQNVVDHMDKIYNNAEAWFGCKNISILFNSDTFSLMFAMYGGGGVESMELWDSSEERKQAFIDRIGNSTDLAGYGILDPNDYTLFEIITK